MKQMLPYDSNLERKKNGKVKGPEEHANGWGYAIPKLNMLLKEDHVNFLSLSTLYNMQAKIYTQRGSVLKYKRYIIYKNKQKKKAKKATFSNEYRR